MWVGVVLDFNHHSDAFFGRFITDITDANNHFFVHQIGDVDEHVCLLDLIGDFMDDDSFSVAVVVDIALCTHVELPLATSVHVNDTVDAVNARPRGEVWAFHERHVFLYRDGRHACHLVLEDSVHVEVDRPGHFGQVVRWNSRGHSHRNTVASIQEEVGQPGWKDRWFLF